MACVDLKLFRSYIGAALPVFTRSHDREYCHSSLFAWHGAAIRDFRFGSELWFSGFIYSLPESTELNLLTAIGIWHKVLLVLEFRRYIHPTCRDIDLIDGQVQNGEE